MDTPASDSLSAYLKVADPLIDAFNAEHKGKIYSDIIDDNGNQYIDLVMEGGGVLGIALVGYTYALEKAGLRFMRVGGTSAGAINAMLLASVCKLGDEASEKILKDIAALDMWKLVDGDPIVKFGLSCALNNRLYLLLLPMLLGLPIGFLTTPTIGILSAFASLLIVPSYLGIKLFKVEGLNPGNYFLNWLKSVLKNSESKIETNEDLEKHLADMPDMKNRITGTPVKIDTSRRLAIISSDITTQTKAEFPCMAEMYWKDHKKVPAASFVRASMSIPYFFNPFIAQYNESNPNETCSQSTWKRLAGFDDQPYPSCTFVDGGIVSNFPINLFHNVMGVPRAPTFGARLGSDTRIQKETSNILKFTGAFFNTARHTLDYDFLANHPDYKYLVGHIDIRYKDPKTGKMQEYNWLNFNMSLEQKVDLFRLGVVAGIKFLEGFDWEQYKEVRRNLVKGHLGILGKVLPATGGEVGQVETENTSTPNTAPNPV